MAADRSFRSLTALTSASTSRVLNLLAISQAHGDKEGYQRNPLFSSPHLNTAIIVKHRLRSDETSLFATQRAVGTAVFGGMLAASCLGIFVIPGLYVAFQRFRETVKGWMGVKPATPTAALPPTTKEQCRSTRPP